MAAGHLIAPQLQLELFGYAITGATLDFTALVAENASDVLLNGPRPAWDGTARDLDSTWLWDLESNTLERPPDHHALPYCSWAAPLEVANGTATW